MFEVVIRISYYSHFRKENSRLKHIFVLVDLIDELKELWNDGILTYDASKK